MSIKLTDCYKNCLTKGALHKLSNAYNYRYKKETNNNVVLAFVLLFLIAF